MYVLLPPSEGKFLPADGDPVEWDSLVAPSLTKPRQRILGSLVSICTRAPRKALTALGLSASQRELVAHNSTLRTAACAPAAEIYTGVLFGELGLTTLSAEDATQANDRLLIFSSLFGIVRPFDNIPGYRLSGNSALPSIGTVDSFWRKHLPSTMSALMTPEVESVASPTDANPTADCRLIVDMRSGTYVKFWPIPPDQADRAVTVKIWQQGPNGSRQAVSHSNKATKGLLARTLATLPEPPDSASELATALTTLGWSADLSADPKLNHPRLDITIPAIGGASSMTAAATNSAASPTRGATRE